MQSGRNAVPEGRPPVVIDPRVRDEVVAFLREWLPREAQDMYRQMIQENPDGWSRDPHFAGGLVSEHFLRGNGIDERVLGILDLDRVWPDLLRRAVEEE
jgi:hypothetical protein